MTGVSSGRRFAWAAVAVAALLRLAFALGLEGYLYLPAITVTYTRSAQALLEGRGFVLDEGAAEVSRIQTEHGRLLQPFEYPEFHGEERPVLGYFPGYPLWLALWLGMGVKTFFWIRLAQVLLDVVACWVLMKIAWEMLGAAAARWAGWFYALWPPIAVSSALLVADALTVPLMVFLVAAVWRAALGGAWKWRMGAALLMAASVYVRPNALLLPAFFAVCAFAAAPKGTRLRQSLVAGGVAAGVLIVSLLPWAWRNFHVTGKWIWTTTSGSVNMWQALGERPNPWGAVVDDRKMQAELAEIGLSWHSLEADEHLKVRFREAVKDDPLFYLSTYAIRMAKVVFTRQFWGLVPAETETSWQDSMKEKGAVQGTIDFARRHPWAFTERVANLFLQALDFFVFILAAAGTWLCARKKMTRVIVVGALPFVYYFTVAPIVHFEPRYALPVYVSYALFVSAAVSAFVERRRACRAAAPGAERKAAP